MNNNVTLKEIMERFQEQGIGYHIMELGNDYHILITEYGGRVFGPFDRKGVSILWVNKVFKDNNCFCKFIEDKGWNLGGDRLWIAPELEFFCTAPEKFDESYTVQKQMDPGNYKMNAEEQQVKLVTHAEVQILKDSTTIKYGLERTFRPASNPLKYMKKLVDNELEYCGYFQDIILKDQNKEKKMYLEPWILTQINPGGKVIVPFMGDFEFVDYYDPVDEKHQKVYKNYVELNITGNRKYKTAYRSANTFGRMGYVNKMQDGDYCLMIRNYYNDPSMPYCSEPWKNLGNKGCSMYFYNDDGSTGGFAEFENSCIPLGTDINREFSYSTTSLWFFFGEKSKLENVIRILLGVDYKI